MSHHPIEAGPDETLDILFGGRIKMLQPSRGYRFSIDAMLLADFVRPGLGGVMVDLGCGCGVIPIVLGLKSGACRVTGIEIQPELADLARK
ncbi:MAG: SAM-dependent methyltransferase, partial [Deltaproteobacteria bacterium]|nr:SAM-dependent methyltransferase [Deltaproteobacteria bacterium]